MNPRSFKNNLGHHGFNKSYVGVPTGYHRSHITATTVKIAGEENSSTRTQTVEGDGSTKALASS